MIINTDLLSVRRSGKFIAIYGTQDDPFSKNYDFLYREEAKKTADALLKISEDIKEVSDQLNQHAESI